MENPAWILNKCFFIFCLEWVYGYLTITAVTVLIMDVCAGCVWMIQQHFRQSEVILPKWKDILSDRTPAPADLCFLLVSLFLSSLYVKPGREDGRGSEDDMKADSLPRLCVRGCFKDTCPSVCACLCFHHPSREFAFAWCEISAWRDFSIQHIKRLLLLSTSPPPPLSIQNNFHNASHTWVQYSQWVMCWKYTF